MIREEIETSRFITFRDEKERFTYHHSLHITKEIFFKHSNFERRTRKVLGNPFPLPSIFPSNIAIEVGFPITIIFLVENRFSNQSTVLKKPQRATQQWLSFLQLHFASLTGVEVLHQFWARSRFTMPTNENTFWRLLMHPTLD